MVATKRDSDERTGKRSPQRFSMVKAIIMILVLGTTAIIGYAGYAIFKKAESGNQISDFPFTDK